MRFNRLFVSALVALTVSACGDDDGPFVPDEFPEESWTFAIYMAADNNLDPFASKDINELRVNGPPENVEVLLFIDRSEAGAYNVKSVPGISAFSGARLFRLDKSNQWEQLEDYGEVNSTSVETLNRFIELAASKPSDRHAMIMWDHGSPTRFGSDETDGGALSVTSLVNAFRTDPDDPNSDSYHFDIVGFDACLMSSSDAVGALQHTNDFHIGSAELEPGDGWDYDGVMRGFYDTDLTPEVLASAIVDSYGDYYSNNPSRNSGLKVTLAAWRTEFEAIQEAFQLLDSAIVEEFAGEPEKEYAAARQAVGNTHKYWTEPDGQSRFVDYGQLIANIGETENSQEITDATKVLVDSLEDVQVAYTSTASLPGTYGLLYTVDPALVSEVSRTNGTRSTSLDRALGGGEGSLEEELKLTDAEVPTVDISNVDVEAATESGPVYDRATLSWSATDDVALDSVTLFSGIRQADDRVLLGAAVDAIQAHGVTMASAEQTVPMAMAGLGVTEEPDVASASAALIVGDVLYVPIAWSSQDQDGTALLIANEHLEIQGAAVESDEGTWAVFTWEEIKEHPITIASVRVFFDPATGETTSEIGPEHPAADLKITPVRLEGDLVLGAVAEDLAENRIHFLAAP